MNVRENWPLIGIDAISQLLKPGVINISKEISIDLE
jgi:hypothetical protein